MNATENPIHAPAPARHHLQKGDEPRIRLCNGPTIDQSTMATLHEWHKKGVSYGELIDRLVTHCLASGYDPVTCLPVPQEPKPKTKSKK